MPIFVIKHVTTYHYRQPVAFGEHRMMLRPRDDGDQVVLDSEIAIAPKPRKLSWTRDELGNYVATAQFDRRAAVLRFESTIRLDHCAMNFAAHDIADEARTFPFARDEDHPPVLPPGKAHPRVQSWAEGFLRADGTADTYDLLIGMTQTIKRRFKHAARHEKGIQTPEQTLKLASGSCRDHALLMIAALCHLGFAARFVSGYLYLEGDDKPEEAVLDGGNTHAWAQVYVPGPGWVDFDPASGTVGNKNLVRIAVVNDPREAIPLQGSYFGRSADQIAMKVAVRVAAAQA
ncbi:MAG: transglutaminase family protein [Pseudolabrys sp.]|nr:transglutaminase family protein [Pseudolabrys sp.]